MRLNIVLIAGALLLAGLPVPAMAAGGAFAEVVAPGEGDELEQTGVVTLAYEGWNMKATQVAGVVELDGARVATFIRDLPDATTQEGARFEFRVDIDASALAPAQRQLSATLWTEQDAAVTTAPVTVQLVPTNLAPEVSVEATEYNRTLDAFVVSGTARDDGQIVEMRLETAFGSSWVSYPEEQFWLLKEASPKPGTHRGTVVAVDDRGLETRVDVTFEVENLPSDVLHANAAYRIGDTIVVDGAATDPDGRIVSVTFVSPWATHTIHFPKQEWTFEVPAAPPEGTHAAHLFVRDEHGGNTTVNLTFDVVAEFRTLYDLTVPVSGGFARLDEVPLPRVVDGLIRLCPDDRDCFAPPMSGSVEVVVGDDSDGRTCLGIAGGLVRTPGYDCAFRTAEQEVARIAWSLAGSGEVRVVVEGRVL